MEVADMYIADLHIHSRYSRATSKDCTPEHLDLWARKKGIRIVGTGDFTHPAWREELTEKLEPAEDGLYVLKEEYRIRDGEIPGEMIPRFVITGEISSIYKKNGKVRKVHSLILLPGLEDAQKISARLEQIGNIHSDGRPILGLDCHDLLEILLELCPQAVYVPAHIWTPHFSLFGAFSGFDTVEECFEDLTPYIHAVETGLSSDPPMNWRVSALDRYQLISNSDAHSPAKLGREANLLDIPLSYEGLARAIQTGEGLYGTIEFFPEEGKYHMDGHRKCNLCLTPAETMKYNGICPVCGRKITIGVSHRVEELADRAEGYIRENAKIFESLVPLPEVIGASEGHSSASVKVKKEYQRMLAGLGPEFEILRNIPLEDIRRVAGTRMAEGIGRLRKGQVERIPGFDGEYGVIRLFTADELSNTEGQMDFFDLLGNTGEKKKWNDSKEKNVVLSQTLEAAGKTDLQETVAGGSDESSVPDHTVTAAGAESALPALNPEQEYAVRCTSLRIAVKAGPGTGKTKTLVSRLRYLLEYRKARPSEITAVTFTNQAAAEMRERISRETGKKQAGKGMQIGTFHAICLDFLKKQGENFTLMEEAEQRKLAEETAAETGLSVSPAKFLEAVSRRKAGVLDTGVYGREGEGQEGREKGWKNDRNFENAFEVYEEKKQLRSLLDFDDLLLRTAEMIESGRAAAGWEKPFRYLLVDEFQDINPIQFRLVKLWSRAGQELFVIGDPDQSIYGFRGADASCFERLKQEYSDLELVELKENYRSSPQILNAAYHVISEACGAEQGTTTGPAADVEDKAGLSSETVRKQLHPNCGDNVPVRLVKAGSPLGEAIFIAKEINRLSGGIGMLEAHQAAWEMDGRKIRSFDEIAVLCRTHHQMELVEKCLRKESIPYIVSGREDFLKDPAVQASIGFFRYLENPEDPTAVMAASACGAALWNLEVNAVADEVIRNTAERFLPLYRKKKPEKFLTQWMEEMNLSENPAMQKLSQMTVFYRTMTEFTDALLLGTESDLKRCGNKRYTSEAVSLMTLHGSKGLEFPVTFIYGAEQGSIPLESENHPSDKAEERRLFYVGMTRAKEELIMTTSGEISEFLQQLPDGLVEMEETTKRKSGEEWHQMSLFEM